MNNLVTPLHAAAWSPLRDLLANRFDNILALVVFGMSVAVLAAGVWVALRMRRDETGL